MPAGLILFAGAAVGVAHSLIPRLLCGSLGMGLGAILLWQAWTSCMQLVSILVPRFLCSGMQTWQLWRQEEAGVSMTIGKGPERKCNVLHVQSTLHSTLGLYDIRTWFLFLTWAMSSVENQFYIADVGWISSPSQLLCLRSGVREGSLGMRLIFWWPFMKHSDSLGVCLWQSWTGIEWQSLRG